MLPKFHSSEWFLEIPVVFIYLFIYNSVLDLILVSVKITWKLFDFEKFWHDKQLIWESDFGESCEWLKVIWFVIGLILVRTGFV